MEDENTLPVSASHKLDVTIGQVAYDVAGAIDAGVFLVVGKGIGDIHLSRFLRAVQVATAHLRTTDPKFSSGSYR